MLLFAIIATFVVLAISVSPPFVYFSSDGESDVLHKSVCWIGAIPILSLLAVAVLRQFFKSPRTEHVLGIVVFFVAPIWLLMSGLTCSFLALRLDVPARTNYWLTSSIGFLALGWLIVLVPWFRKR